MHVAEILSIMSQRISETPRKQGWRNKSIGRSGIARYSGSGDGSKWPRRSLKKIFKLYT